MITSTSQNKTPLQSAIKLPGQALLGINNAC